MKKKNKRYIGFTKIYTYLYILMYFINLTDFKNKKINLN